MRKLHLLNLAAVLMAFGTVFADDFSWTYNPEEGLITDSLQMYANSAELPQFGVGNLIDPSDDYANIIFHTSWSNPLPYDVYNYLQVHLNAAQEDIFFSMIGSNWPYTYDTPDQMEILVTNTPDDEQSWVSVETLPDMIPASQHDVHPAFYTSPHIAFGGAYTDVRFVVKATVNNRSNNAGNIYFSLARFQMYKAVKVEDPVQLLQMALDEIEAAGYRFEPGTDPGFYATDLVEAYEKAVEDAEAAVQSGDAEACRTAKAALLEALASVQDSMNPITDGYYYIVNSDARFKDEQTVEKAMYVRGDLSVGWKTFDTAQECFVFYIEKLKNGNYNIRHFSTNAYLCEQGSGNTVTATSTPSLGQLFTPKGACSWHISNLNNNTAYHAAGHATGAGEEGNVVQWENAEMDFCLWYLRRITDEEFLSELSERQQQQAYSKELAELAKTGREVYNSAFSYITDTENPLITDASQLYANSEELPQFGVFNLIDPSDDYSSIIFHTSWTNPLPSGVYNYLQVHLNEPRENMIFSLVGSNWPGTYDTPDQMSILVTNTPEDEDSWEPVTSLADMIPADQHTVYPAFYTSPSISFGGAYTDVRFVVKATVNNRGNGAGNILFSLARFQMYGFDIDYENSLYYTVEGLEDACNTLIDLIDEADIMISTEEEISQEDIDALTAAITAARELIEGKPMIQFSYTKDLNTGAYWYYNPSDGLLTTEDQLYANSEESSVFRIGRLIDSTNDYNTIIWHTSWSNPLPADTDNYLQFHFNEAHDAFAFTMTGSNWGNTYDTPDHVVFYGTNTPDDEASWKELVELGDLIPDNLHETYPAQYQSPRISLDATYTDLRMVVKSTVNNRSNGNGNIYVSLARMQFYAPREVTDQTVIDSLRKAETDAVVNPLLDTVANLTNKVMGVGTVPLILSDSQLYANSEESKQFYVGRLIDPSTDYNTIIWHTSWTNPLPAGTTNYIKVHLEQPTDYFTFSMIGSNWPATYDTPDHILIQATNTPDDDASWTDIIDMPDLIPADQHGVHPAYYTSPVINMGASYSDVRFMILSTVNMRMGGYGVPYVSLARFQMYGNQSVEEAPYTTVKGMKEAYDAMMAAVEAVKADPSNANINTLRQCVKTVRKMIINMNIEPGKEPLSIVFIGNSITYGACLSSPGTQAPPVKCAEKIVADTGRPVYYQNCGLSGSTTLNWLPGTSLFRNANNAAKNFADNGGYLYFSMMLGTNDSAESGPTGSPVSPEDYGTNMKSIITKLHANHPEARFIVNYPIWYSPNTYNGAVYLQAGLDRLQTYHPVIGQIVADLKAEGIEIWTGSKEAYGFFENHGEDYFVAENGFSGVFYLHPNATGAEYLGGFWAQTIMETLGDYNAIDELPAEQTTIPAIYNMQGMRMADDAPLAPGLYIIGGRKVAVIR